MADRPGVVPDRGAQRAQLPQYQVFAIRYATFHRVRRDNFLGVPPDPHDGPMPMDYFVWLIRGDGRDILVDTGFNQRAADARGRKLLRCPITALSALDLASEQVSDVIITHMHYDHAGNVDLLPRARFHVQESELQYSVSRYMAHKPLRHAYAFEDVGHMVRRLYQDEVVFHDGESRLAPGIELVRVGGHTQGLQIVRVHTARGWVVLASDASHYYENFELAAPFPIVHNVGDMLEGYRTMHRLAESPDHIVPGHDPAVLRRYPRSTAGAEIVALHEAPTSDPDKR
jgi:glyoxylase-like metal-dependent hydrolase (beta-lactamase superfamily II)